MIRIALAEDHQIVREGIRALLDAEPDLSVTGEVGDGLEVVPLVDRLQPDVLVVDLMMPGLGGLDVIREVKRRFPKVLTVVLSMHSDEGYVLEAFRNGASGYVLKRRGAEDLVRAVRDVAEGKRYLAPPLSDRAIESYVDRALERPFDAYDTLTPREREVLHLAAEGLSNGEIGARLSISRRTAETHRAKLMRKLGLDGQTELLHYAARRGLISMDEHLSSWPSP